MQPTQHGMVSDFMVELFTHITVELFRRPVDLARLLGMLDQIDILAALLE